MKFDTVDQWLQWQTSLHDKVIELGLERVREVAARLGLGRIAQEVITVAGTNGKGSSVAAYETWLHNAGYSVASYTSPHLLRYNERVKLGLEPVEDAELCAAFDAVERARENTPLTYFEFGTLAALHLVQHWKPDYAVLEVGLGGRLDAVNIVDPDLVHLTPIGIDHQAYLGNDREQIGYEKAGVLRPGVALVLNDPDPPRSVLDAARRLGCEQLQVGVDYVYAPADDGRIRWRGRGFELQLDRVLPGSHQALNLAGVVAGLEHLFGLANLDPRQINENFRGLTVPGRFQRIARSPGAAIYVDVGHNPDAAAALAASLAELRHPRGRIVVLLGMLEDKDCAGFVEALAPAVDEWWALTLGGERGQSADDLQSRLHKRVTFRHRFARAREALDHALSSLGNQDIMLVTGSFVTVELILHALSDSGENHLWTQA